MSLHEALLEQRLDHLGHMLTLVKTHLELLKDSLSFTRSDINQRFSNTVEKVQSLEKKQISTKKDVGVIQQNQHGHLKFQLENLEDKSRRKNLKILGIEKEPIESWEECENKIYDLLEENLEMDTSNASIERADRVEKK